VRIAAGVVLAFGLGVGFLPLFGGPGYEQSLASGLVVPSAAAIATALDHSRAPRTPLAAVGRGVAAGLLLATIALATALVHGLRVGFCDALAGIEGFVLGPMFGAMLGGVHGAIAGELARGRRFRRAIAVVVALVGPVLSIAVSIGRFYASPMIFAFDPFVGYFSGTLYDTVVDAGEALLSYRAGTLATLTAAALFASILSRQDDGALRLVPLRGDAEAKARGALAIVAACVSLAITASGPSLGHWQTPETIAAELGAELQGVRCRVVYPDNLRRSEGELLLRDCEQQLADIERVLEARGPERVTAYFFRDAAQKKRLMGAADTYIAKPWREEVYLQLQGYPHPVLAHELAHVVAGGFGRGPFRIAAGAYGLLPNPGLIEGIAVAAAPREDELTERQWARAMLENGALPELSSIFSLDFLGANASKSYTVAGAFVAHVLDRYGAAVVRDWYGGRSLEGLTGRSWALLDEEFRAALREVAFPTEALAYAKARFERPGVFARRCPHVVDALRRKGDQCRDREQYEAAERHYADALARDARDEAARFGSAVSKLLAGNEAGRTTLAAMAEDEKAPRTLRDKAEMALGDEAFRRGDFAEALRRYGVVLARTLDDDAARTLEVKSLGARDEAARPSVLALLVGGAEGTDVVLAAARLQAWLDETGDPLPAYLLGKNLAQRGQYGEAAALLDRAGSANSAAVSPRVARELLRQRAIVACASGDDRALGRVRAVLEGESDPFRGTPGGRRAALERVLSRCAAGGTRAER
jgi:tetratricopeptide (TPR) repeat protein